MTDTVEPVGDDFGTLCDWAMTGLCCCHFERETNTVVRCIPAALDIGHCQDGENARCCKVIMANARALVGSDE